MADNHNEYIQSDTCPVKRVKLDHGLRSSGESNGGSVGSRDTVVPVTSQDKPSRVSKLSQDGGGITCLCDLPFETLSLVAEMVASESMPDLHSLSYVSWRFRQISKRYLFSIIFVDWALIDNLLGALECKSKYISDSVRTLCLTKPSSKGEWSKSKALTNLIRHCGNVSQLNVTISGSSSWLKYVHASNKLKLIQVRSQVAVERERLHRCHQRGNRNSNPGLFVQSELDEALLDDISAGHLPQFDIDHLCNLTGVNELILEGFNVSRASVLDDDSDGDQSNIAISKLGLFNCTWSYPYQVEHFSNNITDLTVVYTEPYRALTYYERLKSLAQSPPTTLKRFELDLVGRSPKNQMAWQPLSHHKCHNLESLSIKGFVLPDLCSLRNLPDSLTKFDIELALCERNRSSIDLPSLQKSYLHNLNRPGLELNLRAVYWPDTDTDVRSLYSQFQSAPDYGIY